jgi:hypothetical protein
MAKAYRGLPRYAFSFLYRGAPRRKRVGTVCASRHSSGVAPRGSSDPYQRGSRVSNGETDARLLAAVARQLLLGRRESLTMAGEIGVSVTTVNEALLRLRDACHGCITLLQPYAGEPRFIVVVDDWEALKRMW